MRWLIPRKRIASADFRVKHDAGVNITARSFNEYLVFFLDLMLVCTPLKGIIHSVAEPH